MENMIIATNYDSSNVVAVDILPNHNKIEIDRDGVTFEYVTLKDSVVGSTEIHIVEVGSNDWYALKCVEIPQKIAKKYKGKGGKHFEETDLVSYLTELAYRKLCKFDRSKVDYFESFMRRWLSKNVVDFFRDTKIDKITDLETTLVSKNADEEGGDVIVFDEPVDIWAELHSELELEELIQTLEAEEQLIVRRLLDGYNLTEIASEVGTYKMKVSRQVKALIEKAKMEKPKDRKTRVNAHLESTTKGETIESVRHYEKTLEKGRVADKILGMTAKIWGLENKLSKEMLKLDTLEGEARLRKESTLNTWAEILTIARTELLELEKKLQKLNK